MSYDRADLEAIRTSDNLMLLALAQFYTNAGPNNADHLRECELELARRMNTHEGFQ